MLEALMLICFGVSWPFSIYRTWKAKRIEGKSLIFLVIVFVGYLVGAASKFVKAAGGKELEKIVICYGINAVLVGIDLILYMRYRKRAAPLPAPAGAPVEPPVE